MQFDIVERVCTRLSPERYMLLYHAIRKDTQESVWLMGDDHVCAVTRKDCLRNRALQYNDVLIQEFPYETSTPDSVGEWLPLIEEMIKDMVEKYLDRTGVAHVYPQWMPKEAYAHLGQELFDQMCENCAYLTLTPDNMMIFEPKAKD